MGWVVNGEYQRKKEVGRMEERKQMPDEEKRQKKIHEGGVGI